MEPRSIGLDALGLLTMLLGDRDVDRLGVGGTVITPVEEGVQGGRIFFVVFEPFDEQPVGSDPHLGGPGSGGEKPDASREILDGASEKQLGEVGREAGPSG